jgi:competence protein ComEA
MKRLIALLAMLCAFAGAALAAVNINTATEEELQTLKGIGPAKARAIIEYRRQHGPFQNIDELDNVKGIGKSTIDDLRSSATVSGGGARLPAPAKAPDAARTAAPAKPAVTTAPSSGGGSSKSPEPTKAATATAAPARPALPASASPAGAAKPAEPAKPGVGSAPAAPAKPAPPAATAGVGAPAKPAIPARPSEANKGEAKPEEKR